MIQTITVHQDVFDLLTEVANDRGETVGELAQKALVAGLAAMSVVDTNHPDTRKRALDLLEQRVASKR